jgi:hypothetical protein
MKPDPADEIADRDAEERSENEGMPEHAVKAHDPVRWAADRGTRVRQRLPERSPGGADRACQQPSTEPPRRHVKEITMRPNPTPPTSTGYVSAHRFGLTMLACALVLGIMLAAVYKSVGFTPIWASHTIAGVS